MVLLSIIVPVYNEEKTVKKVIDELKKLKIEKEIIVVDDGSTDSTRKILKKIKGIRLYYHKKNQGKGSAVTTGIKHSKGKLIIIQDADLEYNPKEIPKLIEAMDYYNSDAVYGYRFLKIKGKRIILHDLGNRILSFITSLLFLRSIPDMETCYKLIKRDFLEDMKLRSKRFEIEPEITAKLIKKGAKIISIPIAFKPRSYEEGKKIRIKDGLIALYTLFKFRISSLL